MADEVDQEQEAGTRGHRRGRPRRVLGPVSSGAAPLLWGVPPGFAAGPRPDAAFAAILASATSGQPQKPAAVKGDAP